MKFCLAYRFLIQTTITLVWLAGCGETPPSLSDNESDSSAISTDNEWDDATDTDEASAADTGTGNGSDSAEDTDTGTGSDSPADTDTGTGSGSAPDTGTGGGSDSAEDTDTGTGSDSPADIDTDTGSDSSCFDPSGHDEDSDGIHDFCDNCPSVANANQAVAGDGDELGDACEAPGRPGLLDRIAVFEPFTDQGSDWDADKGTWSWLSDMVQGAAPGGNSGISGFFVHEAELGNGAYAVEATFYHDQGGNVSDWTPFTGVIFAWTESDFGTKFWTCLYEWDTNAMSIWRTLDGSIQRSVKRDNVDSAKGDTTIWRRIRAIWDGEEITCEFSNEIGDYKSLSVPKEHTWKDIYMSGQAGLRIYNETSSFSSFVIYN